MSSLMWRLVAIGICLLAQHHGTGVVAYREFLRSLPNSQLVPCPTSNDAKTNAKGDSDGGSYSDNNCWGTGVCGAFGHTNCLNEDRNAFGEEFDDNEHHWTYELCVADTDDDGSTNGDELGDQCCRWNVADVPSRTSDIGHPANSEIQPAHASCLLAGVPSSPSDLHIFANPTGAEGQVILTWQSYEPRDTCVCSFTLYIEEVITDDGSSDAQRVRWNRTDIDVWPTSGDAVAPLASLFATPLPSSDPKMVVCDLPKNMTLSYRLIANNLAGASLPSNATISLPWVESPHPAPLVCNDAMIFVRAGDGPVWSTWSALPAWSWSFVFLLPFVLLLVSSCLHSRRARQNPRSTIRQLFLHTHCSPPLVTADEPSLLPRADPSLLQKLQYHIAACVNPMLSMALGPALCVILFVIACIWYCCYQLYVYQPQLLFTYGEGLSWPRAIGNLCCMPLTFIFFPVTKHSVLLHLLGLPYDRAVMYHRWLGRIAIALIMLHGIGMTIALERSAFGWTFLFDRHGIDQPILYGTLAGILFIVMSCFTWECVRRNHFKLFMMSHMLYLPALVLASLHYNGLLNYLYVGGGLYVLDYLLLGMDACRRPSKLVSVQLLTHALESEWKHPNNGVEEKNDARSLSPSPQAEQYIELVISKPKFDFQPGQFVFLLIPAISLLPHPFTICSLPRELRRGTRLSRSYPTAPASSISFISTLMLPDGAPAATAAMKHINIHQQQHHHHSNSDQKGVDDDSNDSNDDDEHDSRGVHIEMAVLDPTSDLSAPAAISPNNIIPPASTMDVFNDGVPSIPSSSSFPSLTTMRIIADDSDTAAAMVSSSPRLGTLSPPSPDRIDGSGMGGGWRDDSLVSVIVKCMRPGVKDTFGSRLTKVAHTLQNETRRTATFPSVAMFGPFGCTTISLTHYHTVLMVAGGVGITPLLSHWLSLAAMVSAQRHRRTSSSSSNGGNDNDDDTNQLVQLMGAPKSSLTLSAETMTCRHVFLVWSFRDISLYTRLAPAILSAARAVEDVIRFTFLPHCSSLQPDHAQLDVLANDWKVKHPQLPLPRLDTSRPDLNEIMTRVASAAIANNDDDAAAPTSSSSPVATQGYVGVATCGPQSLMAGVRRSAAQSHAATFHVHTETFEL